MYCNIWIGIISHMGVTSLDIQQFIIAFNAEEALLLNPSRLSLIMKIWYFFLKNIYVYIFSSYSFYSLFTTPSFRRDTFNRPLTGNCCYNIWPEVLVTLQHGPAAREQSVTNKLMTLFWWMLMIFLQFFLIPSASTLSQIWKSKHPLMIHQWNRCMNYW